jgi:nucleoside 2-deoxyribosyltransferase
MRPEDLKTIELATGQMREAGIDGYVAERDVQLGANLSAKLAQAITRSDCFVAFLTQGGSASAYVQQEIGFAVAYRKPVITIVEKGLQPQGFLVGVEYLELDREDPQPTIQRLTAYLSAQHAEQQRLRAERAERQVAIAQIQVETAEQRLARAQGQATIATAIAVGALLALAIIAIIVLSSSPLVRGGGAGGSGAPAVPPLPSG